MLNSSLLKASATELTYICPPKTGDAVLVGLIDKTDPPRSQNIFVGNSGSTTRDTAKMPPYDSDSADDEEEYKETNVLLGYATSEPTGDAVSHLGGVPVYIPLRLLRCDSN
jgi:hypothetical protein